MNATRSTLTHGILAAAVLATMRFVTYAGTVPAAKAPVLGVTRTGAAVGERVAVDIGGILEVEAGGAFAKGDALETDALGRAVLHTDGVTVGRALAASAGAGSIALFNFIPN